VADRGGAADPDAAWPPEGRGGPRSGGDEFRGAPPRTGAVLAVTPLATRIATVPGRPARAAGTVVELAPSIRPGPSWPCGNRLGRGSPARRPGPVKRAGSSASDRVEWYEPRDRRDGPQTGGWSWSSSCSGAAERGELGPGLSSRWSTCAARQPVGVEGACLRWRHPELGHDPAARACCRSPGPWASRPRSTSGVPRRGPAKQPGSNWDDRRRTAFWLSVNVSPREAGSPPASRTGSRPPCGA